MTIEEARKVLDGELLVLTLENNVASEAQKKRLNEKFAALNVVISALDKQIPKKPVEKKSLDVSLSELRQPKYRRSFY